MTQRFTDCTEQYVRALSNTTLLAQQQGEPAQLSETTV